MKKAFYRVALAVSGLALLLVGVALVDFVLHPLAGDYTFTSPIYRSAMMLIIIPLTLLVAFLSIRRAPGNVVGPLLVVWTGTLAYKTVRPDLSSWIFGIFSWYDIAFGWLGLFLMLQHFPDGEIYPRGARRWVYPLVAFSPGFTALIFLSNANLQIPFRMANPYFQPVLEPYTGLILNLSLLFLSPILIMAIVSPVMHFRQGSQRERQQIKWLTLFGGFSVFYSIVMFILIPVITGGEVMNPGSGLRGLFYYLTVSLFPPLTIGVAILRHHLWDIDLIIRRTLLYTAVTGLLALVYLLSVTVLQAVFSAISGEQSSLAIALSTLAIAALFNPLRRRVQSFIDRRFYRRKYDADRALADFAASARSETDLECLTGKLTGAIQETLQPSQVSLWLKRNPK